MLRFGSALIQTVRDLDPFALPVDLLFPGRTVEDLREHADLLAPHHVDFDAGSILLGVQSHVVRIGGLVILIDTCIGEHKPRAQRRDWHQRQATGYLERLSALGLTPDDVDIVLCTHLHADHVGWNTQWVDGRWVPTFPRARYLISRDEFEQWQAAETNEAGRHNHGSFIDSVAPIVEAGQADLVEDGFALADGVTLMALPGHTRGQLGLCLCHGERRAVFSADAVHTPVQVFRPDWASRFCSDQDRAIATRRSLFEAAADRDDLLLPAHLRHVSAMRIRRTGGGYRPEFVP